MRADGGVTSAGAAEHGSCLNCGTGLAGDYCHTCGQNSHLHRTLGGFGHDLLHGAFHFDGKFWRTLPALILRPGELTRRYIHGERVKFVSPLAMFLFSAFLLYMIVGSLAGEMRAPEVRPADMNRSIGQIKAQLKTEQAARAALNARMEATPAAQRESAEYTTLEQKRDEIDQEISALQMAQGVVSTSTHESRSTLLEGGTGWPALDQGLRHANENPSLFFYRLQTSAYKYSWALIPISTPLLWLLFFWKPEYKLYDHIVFVTYSLTFMALLVVVLSILGALGVPGVIITMAALIIPPVHSYRQLRGAYRCGPASALVRTILLMIFGFAGLALFVMLLLAMGLMH
jgi:hypothetical protein